MLLCLCKQIKHHIAAEGLNLTILGNEDTNVDGGGIFDSPAASSSATVEIAFV